MNYLSHFLLTRLLSDLLKASAPSRVITVSGDPKTLRKLRIDFDDIQHEKRYHPIAMFLQTGLARALFSFELARRLEGTGVTSNTFHPGLVKTGLVRNLPWYLRIPASVGQIFLSSKCETGVYMATASELETVSGRIFVGKREVAFTPRLWPISETLARI